MSKVIKNGDLFLFTDDTGNIPEENTEEFGLFMKDTRFLNRMEWSMGGLPVRILSTESNGAESLFRYTNGDGQDQNGERIRGESLEVERCHRIYGGIFYETFTLTNRGRKGVVLPLRFYFDADFSDLFVIRGHREAQPREARKEKRTDRGYLFSCRGPDEVERSLEMRLSPAPDRGEKGTASLTLFLEPGGQKKVRLTFLPGVDGEVGEVYEETLVREAIQENYREWFAACPEVDSDSEVFNELYRRSLTDLRMLMTDLGEGPLPVAGLPWYGVPRGRDGGIVALQSLPIHPETAINTARTLARYQGKEIHPYREEEPGKIMLEIRCGELAETETIPHTPYYGSIDATPLFLILVAEIHRWTGDDDFIREMLPSVRKAMEWIDIYGDPGEYGYTAYDPRSGQGMGSQGWKDSEDSHTHIDGTLAQPPIVLAEVQGYVHLAKTAWAQLFHGMGNIEESRRLFREAKQLRERFNRDFWMETEDFPAIALDKEKKKVANVSSNPGHGLLAGMFEGERADRVVSRLMEPDLFNGWGIRTLSSKAPSYNPSSYYNGSVWPHDNALILLGMKRQGYDQEAEQLIRGLLAAASRFSSYRLPELFRGCGKEEGEPVPYPDACSPQAWAAGTVFSMLQAMLGLEPEASRQRILLSPGLPEGINRLEVRRIPVGRGSLDLRLIRQDGRTYTRIEGNTSGWAVVLDDCDR